MIRKLTPIVHEKVWGSTLTLPWLANPEGRKIGEIWFSAPEVLPVLVKLLFTTERMSVQVHPGDAYAQAHGAARGKTEMWHVLRHDPGATVALGLRETVSGERLREAALSGDIVDLLDWIPARTGDTFFVPAGTIHAIGSGLVLCEVQQYSDVTYRLFDYHRTPERPLHLEDSLAVAHLGPVDRTKSVSDCEYFQVERLPVQGNGVCDAASQPFLYVAVAGEGKIAGEPFRQGEAWLVPAGTPSFAIESQDGVFMIVSETKGISCAER